MSSVLVMDVADSQLLLRRAETRETTVTGMTVLQRGRDVYFGLDDVGQELWQLLAEPRTLADLVEHLVTTYGIDQATARRDLDQFIASLVDAQLVTRERPMRTT